MTSPEQRAIDFAGGTVIHINWPFIFFALLVALSVVVIFAVRKNSKRSFDGAPERRLLRMTP